MTTLDVPPHLSTEVSPNEPEPPMGGWWPAVRLGTAVVALGAVSVAAGFWKALLVIIALFVMIMLHELGHFVMAKRAGMKATEFFVGFGPRLWSIRRGETEYGVKAIPLGGYVKIIGMTNLEEVAPEDEHRAYRQKPFWDRFGVAVAGSTMHMVIAFVLLFTMNTVVGNGLHGELVPVISSLSAIDGQDSPAAKAGLKVGDEITALDGGPVVSWDDVRSYIASRPGVAIRVDYLRDGKAASTTVTPVDANVATGVPTSGAPRGFVGISATAVDPTVGPVQALGRSVLDFGTLAKATGGGLTQILSFQGVQSYADQVQGKAVPEAEKGNRFLSPVGVYKVAGEAADQGLSPVFSLLVLINIFVGFFNMLPLLPFDGGHAVLAIYEAVRSKIKGVRHFADAGKLMPVAYVTVGLLALIFVSSLYLDITRPIKLS